MKSFDDFLEIIRVLRSENGCPWDRRQTHSSLKPSCIEEAAEVVCAVNILEAEDYAGSLKEELGDLLLQVVMHAVIAEEEGLFTMDDVIKSISEKMIHRHPHVFGTAAAPDKAHELQKWDEIKAAEKAGKPDFDMKYLCDAFNESKELIEAAKKRKGYA